MYTISTVSTKTQQSFFSTIHPLSVCEVFISSRSSTVRCAVVYMQGDVAQNTIDNSGCLSKNIRPTDAMTRRQWSFRSTLVKIAWFYCKRLQNNGALNFVHFSGPPCIHIRLFATKAEKRNETKDRTHRQRQTDTVVYRTNLQYYIYIYAAFQSGHVFRYLELFRSRVAPGRTYGRSDR